MAIKLKGFFGRRSVGRYPRRALTWNHTDIQLGTAAAFACQSLIAETLSRAEFSGHPLFDEGSSWQPDLSLLIHRWVFDWARHGDAYLLIHRSSGMPTSLEFVEVEPGSSRWDAQKTDSSRKDTKNKKYVAMRTFRRDGDPGFHATAPDSMFVGLHWGGFDGLDSPSPLLSAAQGSVDLFRAAQSHHISLIRNLPKVYIEQDKDMGPLNEASLKAFQKRVQERTDMEDIPMAFPPGLKLEALFNASEAELLNAMRFSVEDIARAYSVPPEIIGHYASGQRSSQPPTHSFPRGMIRARAKMMEGALTRALHTQRDRELGQRVKINLMKVEQGSFDQEAKALAELASNHGILTRNEVRELLNYPPLPGGDELMSPKGAPAPQEETAPPEESPETGEEENEEQS